MRTAWKVSFAVAAVVSLTGCTDASQPSDEQARSTPTIGAAAETAPADQGAGRTEPAGEECAAADIQVAGQPGQAPEVTIPDGCAEPSTLISEDLRPGQGQGAEEGDSVTVHYQLVTWSDGQVKDSSWQRGEPLEVNNLGPEATTGGAPVVTGWGEGLVGIKEGARRLLVVPPEKGYGDQQGHELQSETLVFVIDATTVG